MSRAITGILFCAKCHKPVDRIETAIDPMTGDYVFTAFCHGAVDTCILSRREVVFASSIEYATAFRGEGRESTDS